MNSNNLKSLKHNSLSNKKFYKIDTNNTVKYNYKKNNNDNKINKKINKIYYNKNTNTEKYKYPKYENINLINDWTNNNHFEKPKLINKFNDKINIEYYNY
jgi:hypothetical protein